MRPYVCITGWAKVYLWTAFTLVEPGAVKGQWSKLVDVIALVRHVVDPDCTITPFSQTVEERYQAWLSERAATGATFTPDQRRWLDAIKQHIATSLQIQEEDFYDAPFAQLGGLGKAYELFGGTLPAILEELNRRLAA